MAGRFLRSTEAVSRRIAGKVFIVAPYEGRVTLLNEVGGRVWELLEGPKSADEIAHEIEGEFDAPAERGDEDERIPLDHDAVLADVERFLHTLTSRGLAQATGDAADAGGARDAADARGAPDHR
jgi:hypothetical protein